VIFGNAVLMGLLVGAVFLDVRGNGPGQTQYQLSFVFMVIIVVGAQGKLYCVMQHVGRVFYSVHSLFYLLIRIRIFI